MLVELYVFFEIVMLIVFFIAFFTKQEILWAISAIFSGFLMYSSFDIQTYVYEFNSTINAYSPIVISNNFIYLVWINLIFLALSVILGLFDMFDKYGSKIFKRGEKEENE
jgi:prepilin signal peptidase PulO-like enzyme (type II secretory pathway)